MDASTLTRDTSNSFSNTTDPNENGFSSTNCDFALPRGTTQGRGYGGGGGEWDRVSCPLISFFFLLLPLLIILKLFCHQHLLHQNGANGVVVFVTGPGV